MPFLLVLGFKENHGIHSRRTLNGGNKCKTNC
nr:MAG TPA: hypothetical protein [Caudoviricetes sp.]